MERMDSSEVASDSDEEDITDSQDYELYRQALFLNVAALQHTAQRLTQELDPNEKFPFGDKGLVRDVICSDSTSQAGSLSGVKLWSLEALEGSAQDAPQHVEYSSAIYQSKDKGQSIAATQQELVCLSEYAQYPSAGQHAESSKAETEAGTASVASGEWPSQMHQATEVLPVRKSRSESRLRTSAPKAKVRSRQKPLGPAQAAGHTLAGLSGSPERPGEPVDELAAALQQSRADQEELLAEVAASRALCAELALQRAQHASRAAAIEAERQRRQAELQVVAAAETIAAGIACTSICATLLSKHLSALLILLSSRALCAEECERLSTAWSMTAHAAQTCSGKRYGALMRGLVERSLLHLRRKHRLVPAQR